MEILTDNQIRELALCIDNLQERFEFAVIEFLKREMGGDLYILSDFYDHCCEYLDLKPLAGRYWNNKRIIQRRLKKMKDKGLIDWRRLGVGYGGKSQFGMTSLNTYVLPNFWLN